MKINQKLISGFFVSSLLILAVSYISITLQERLTTDFQKLAGEVLPGTVALVKMDAALYHSLTSATEYASTGEIEVKKDVESMIADLRKYLTIHRLLHAGHDAPGHMEVIEEKMDTVINFITEYILLKDKGGTEKELNIVKEKISRTVDDFRSSLEPFINQHVEDSRRIAKTARENIAHTRKLVVGSSAIILILSVILGFFVARLISRPILKLTEAAIQIGKGNLDTKIEIESKDEIGELARSFNGMAKDLQMITVSRDAFAQEVAERTRAEEALQKSEEDKTNILQTMSELVVYVDTNMKILWANRAAADSVGLTVDALVGKYCYKEWFQRSELCPFCPGKKILENGESQEGETYSPDGRVWHFRGYPVKDENGDVVGIVEVVEEITKRKRAEEEKEKLQTQLLQAQKMEAIGTLAGGISHDFNNILQAISGYTQLLLMKKEENDPDSLYLNQINRSAERASELTKQLLIFSRKMESKLRPVDLNQEVILVHKLLQRTIPKMIDIELRLAEGLKILNADPIQIEQIMMNLGVNAKDAMPEGGKLTFETSNVILDEEYCKAHLEAVPGEYVLLAVSDTGRGMNKETLEHIFEPFYTTKKTGEGTGLGLAMVYGIVKNHGGHIVCYSDPGQGTVFKIYFPVLEIYDIRQKVEADKRAEIRGGNETILLVDDEETLRALGQDILSQYGYKTITAESGEKAIEIYTAEKNRIDLLILDVGMPGMGGHKCLEELLRIDPDVKAIIASGYTGSGKGKEVLETGAAGFIGKPYRLTDMLNKTREVLDQG